MGEGRALAGFLDNDGGFGYNDRVPWSESIDTLEQFLFDHRGLLRTVRVGVRGDGAFDRPPYPRRRRLPLGHARRPGCGT